MIKKIVSCTCIVLFVITVFSVPTNIAGAKTLQDLINELNKLEKDNQANEENIKLTEEQIATTKKEVNKIYATIELSQKDINRMNQEIIQMNKDIKSKSGEIKDLARYMQVTNGESIYFEYLFGSDTITDFLYRLSVVEQISEYNNKLIKDMNDKIAKNETKKKELKAEEERLTAKQKELKVKLVSLGQHQNELYEVGFDLKSEIKSARAYIKLLQDTGCRLGDDVSSCGQLKPDTQFWRPLMAGYVTEEYCNTDSCADDPGGGVRIHPAMDFANGGTTYIYAAAAGKVVTVASNTLGNKSDTAGNYVAITHNINGKKFTTTYMHMQDNSIRVYNGQSVSKDTILGIMGNTGYSFGTHLHFVISTGWKYEDWWGWNQNLTAVNPRRYVNIPENGGGYYGLGSWSNRTSCHQNSYGTC